MSDFNTDFTHDFRRKAGRILLSGMTRSLMLTGAVDDLFYVSPELAQAGYTHGQYVGLTEYLKARWGDSPGTILLVLETNGKINFTKAPDKELLRQAWVKLSRGEPSHDTDTDIDIAPLAGIRGMIESAVGPIGKQPKKVRKQDPFETLLTSCINKPAVALTVLKHLCKASRGSQVGDPLYKKNLLIIIRSAEMIIPKGDIARLNEGDRRRVTMLRDWFSDMDFMHGKDSVVLITESRSMLNDRVEKLPQVLHIEIPAPDLATREHFIEWFDLKIEGGLNLWGTKQDLAEMSAGLSLHALHQMLIGSSHDNQKITIEHVIERIKFYMVSQLGEGVVDFKRPTHTLESVVGFRRLKRFLVDELIPNLRSTDPEVAIPGFGVAGPIRSGKTFIFEAVAAELGMLVLVLKNIRSRDFGGTDLILERLYRVLISLDKVMIFMDEADTILGGVGPDVHATERRATGKIQSWMSDQALLGKVVWLLMTARIHLLSPDIRGPGRIDLIIPIGDPEGDDRDDFMELTLKAALNRMPAKGTANWTAVNEATAEFSAGAFMALRRKLKSAKILKGGSLTVSEVVELVRRQLQPDIGDTRRYQHLQALLNCTDRSLMPDPDFTVEDVKQWRNEIRQLEAMGIS